MLQELVDQLGQAVRFTLDLGEKLTPGGLVPLHVRSPERTHEPFDVTQRQAQLVRHHSKQADS
jgi:hypothetical protein